MTLKRLAIFAFLLGVSLPVLGAQTINGGGGGLGVVGGGGSGVATPWSFTASGDTVNINGNRGAYTNSADLGVASAKMSREFFSRTQRTRMRQAGPYYKVALYNSTTTELDTLVFRWWRWNGSTYALIDSSENVAGKISASAGVDTVTFTSGECASCLPGDFYSVRYVKTQTGTGRNYGKATALATYSQLTEVESDDGTPYPGATFNWNTATNMGAYYQDVRFFGSAPVGVFVGSSIVAGHTGTTPTHYSYAGDNLTPANANNSNYNNPDSALVGWFESISSYTCQNMGIGGEGADGAGARFTNDVINLSPRFVVVEGGSNNVNSSDSTTVDSLIVTHVANMRDAARTAGIVFIYTLIPPRPVWVTGGEEYKCEARDMINQQLRAMLMEHDYADSTIVIDLDYAIGKEHTTAVKSYGGRAYGNRWDLTPPNDGAHLQFGSGNGYRLWAYEIYNALQKSPRSGAN